MAGTGGDEGAGKMMGTVVFVAAFLIVIVFMLSSFGQIISKDESYNAVELTARGFSAADMATYDFYVNSEGNKIYNVTTDMVADSISIATITVFDDSLPRVTGGRDDMWFVTADDLKIHFYVMNWEEIIFWYHDGWWDSHTAKFDKDDIVAAAKPVNGVMRATLPFGPYTAFVIFPNGTSVASVLESHEGYSVSVGQSSFQAYEQSANNAWNYVTGILTFDMPGDGTGVQMFDVMISVVVYAGILFIAFWAITRVIGAVMI
jgi:hypothetical protein